MNDESHLVPASLPTRTPSSTPMGRFSSSVLPDSPTEVFVPTHRADDPAFGNAGFTKIDPTPNASPSMATPDDEAARDFERAFRTAYRIAFRLLGDRRRAAAEAARALHLAGGATDDGRLVRQLLASLLGPSPRSGPVQVAAYASEVWGQHRERIARELNRHSEERRLALTLRYLADREPESVARLLGVDPDSTRKVTAMWVPEDDADTSLLGSLDQWVAGAPRPSEESSRSRRGARVDLTHLDDTHLPARAPRSLKELPPLERL